MKDRAEAILSELGVSASSAITMFYKQIIMQRGLPFDVRLPSRHPSSLSGMSVDELESALDAGYTDVMEGRTRPATEVFDALYEKD